MKATLSQRMELERRAQIARLLCEIVSRTTRGLPSTDGHVLYVKILNLCNNFKRAFGTIEEPRKVSSSN